MSDNAPLVRQWILLRTLCSRRTGVTVREAAEEFGVSQKTIRRDLEIFQQAGFPLEEIAQDHGRKAYRSQRIRIGKFRNFTPAEEI